MKTSNPFYSKKFPTPSQYPKHEGYSPKFLSTAPCPNWPREPRKTNTWLTERTKCTSTRHPFSARCSTDGSETWCTYIRQEHRLNSFHLQCLKRILGVKWQDHVTNSEIQSRAGTPACTPYSVSAAWDGWGMVITWMMDVSPKKFYKVNWRESGNSGAPLCGSKTHANMTVKHAKLIQNNWENTACDRASWRRTVKEGIEKADVKRHRKAEEKRDRRWNSSTLPFFSFICVVCGRDCYSPIGDVAAPPRIAKGAQVLLLETWSSFYMATCY